jgi:rhodanese-related sulfurtransferase
MNTISREVLKERLDRSEPIQLVMALGRWAYDQLHIPGSLYFEDINDAAANLSHDQEIVIYCANPACPASYRAYYHLKSKGYTKVTRFSGGIEDWIEAGLPVESSAALTLTPA